MDSKPFKGQRGLAQRKSSEKREIRKKEGDRKGQE
jgi:hypothetical protein